MHAFLAREIEVFQMQVRIQSQAKEEIGRMQREHYLREQMRAIKSELGDGDSKEDIEELWTKAEKVKLSEEAREEVKRQIKRLERMHQDTSEATLTRTHIETLLSLPWGVSSDDSLDIKNAQRFSIPITMVLQRSKKELSNTLPLKNSTQRQKVLSFVLSAPRA